MEAMITSAVFLLKKYVRTKRTRIEALSQEEAASQTLVLTLKEAQTLVDHLDASVRSLDVTFKIIDKKIRDKMTMAEMEHSALRARRNTDTDSQLSGNHVADQHVVSHQSQTIPLPAADQQSASGRLVPIAAAAADSTPVFRCPFCLNRSYSGKPPLLRHITDMHADRYHDYERIYSLTPEFMFSSSKCCLFSDKLLIYRCFR